MSKRGFGVTMACVLGAVWLNHSAVAADTDKITLVRGKEVISGKISKDDRDGLEVEIRDKGGNAKRTFNSSEVADVEWDVSTDGFHEGIAAFRSGNYERAADALGAIATQAEVMNTVRPVARPYVLYMYAESLYRGGKSGEAFGAYQKLIDGFKTSRYVPFALSSMADAAIQAKAFDKLPSLLAQLREGGPEQKQSADFYEGESLMMQGKAKEALSKYMNAIAGGAGRVKVMATVGQARAQAATGDPAKARELAQQALQLGATDRLAARAHVIIGDAILADIDAKKLSGTALQNALLDAVLDYMRIQNQYPADNATEGYALLKIGECFKRLSKLTTRAGNDDRERAITAFGKLQSERRFQGELANQAFKHMEEMK